MATSVPTFKVEGFKESSTFTFSDKKRNIGESKAYGPNVKAALCEADLMSKDEATGKMDILRGRVQFPVPLNLLDVIRDGVPTPYRNYLSEALAVGLDLAARKIAPRETGPSEPIFSVGTGKTAKTFNLRMATPEQIKVLRPLIEGALTVLGEDASGKLRACGEFLKEASGKK